jgi:hypothetical protein
LIEIGLLVLEKNIFKIFSVVLSPLESPLPKDDLCQVWLKLSQRFWRGNENVKVYRPTGRGMGRRVIRKAHLYFQLTVRRAKKQEAKGPHRSSESFWLIFLIKTNAKLLFFIVAPTALGP